MVREVALARHLKAASSPKMVVVDQPVANAREAKKWLKLSAMN